MKRILIFALALSLLLWLTACGSKMPYYLEGTASVEIHAYGNESAEPVAEFIVKGEDAERIEEMFSTLNLKEMKYTEPSIRGYEFWFRDSNGNKLQRSNFRMANLLGLLLVVLFFRM